jgi:hypothetical protein
VAFGAVWGLSGFPPEASFSFIVHHGVAGMSENRLRGMQLVLGVFALMASQQAAQAETIAVTKDFWPVELSWTGRMNETTYRGLWTVFLDKSGEIVICGAGQFLDSSRMQPTEAWLKSIYVKVGDVKVMKDMSFFTKVKSTDDLSKAKATCKSTGKKPAKGATSVSMGWPPGTARF